MRRKLFNGKMVGAVAVILMLFVAVGVAGEERTDASGQWKYVPENGGATITGYVGKPNGDLVVPGALDGVPVTGIGDSAFEFCISLTNVQIPNSVTRIGDYAFSSCSGLIGVTIPEGVTSVGDYAFSFCGDLTLAPIPKSVTSIGENPFAYCSLESFEAADGNARFSCLDGVLFDKWQELLIAYPGARKGAYTIPETVTSIGDSAFCGCAGLTGVTIPEGVAYIGSSAFFGCRDLTEVTIPENVASIGDSAFSGCSGLTRVTIPEGVTCIGDSTFSLCAGLTDLRIPEGVTSIGEDAFALCYRLPRLTVPKSVTSIGPNAFYGCKNLTLTVTSSSYAEEYAKENNIPYENITE